MSAPLDLMNGSLYPATSLISMKELAGTPVLTPQEEYVKLEGKEGKEKGDQVRRRFLPPFIGSPGSVPRVFSPSPSLSLSCSLFRLTAMWCPLKTKLKGVLLSKPTTSISKQEVDML